MINANMAQTGRGALRERKNFLSIRPEIERAQGRPRLAGLVRGHQIRRHAGAAGDQWMRDEG